MRSSSGGSTPSLRRSRIASEQKIVVGRVVLDSSTYTVSREGETLELPKKEFELLYKLLSYPGQIFTRNQLLDGIWGYDSESGEDTVKTHISRLRNKLRDIPEFRIVTHQRPGIQGGDHKGGSAIMKKRKRGRNRTLEFWLALEVHCGNPGRCGPLCLLHPGEPILLAPGLHGAGPGHAGDHGAAWWASPPPCSAASSTGWSSGLTRGLRAVADGDFSQRLEPEKGGPLQPAYEDFNKMSMELQSSQTLRTDFINHFSHRVQDPHHRHQGLCRAPSGSRIPPRRSGTSISRSFWTSPPAGRPGQQHPAAHQAGVPAVHRGEAALLPGRADQAVHSEIAREKKQISFTANLEPAEFDGNEELMRHVWVNLLSNAVKYTPEGGEITVSLQTGPEELTVSVSDTGIGMSEEVRSHIFDKYYQGNPNGSGRGLGLGLSIVQRIVELCGGQIQVNSVEDQGSIFTVQLPREH